jgi:hypothetical protein
MSTNYSKPGAIGRTSSLSPGGVKSNSGGHNGGTVIQKPSVIAASEREKERERRDRESTEDLTTATCCGVAPTPPTQMMKKK